MAGPRTNYNRDDYDRIMRLPRALEEQLREEIVQMELKQSKPYVSMFAHFEREEGREEGLKKAREVTIRLLLRLLTHQFGEIPVAIQERVHTLSLDQAEPLVDAVLTSASLTQFAEHLPSMEDTETSS